MTNLENQTNNKPYLAIVFAGQGAQKPGMGKSLYDNSAAARRVFDLAGDDIKYDCFESEAEHLMQTEITQPAVYTMDMACFAALKEAAGEAMPDTLAYAGFSLGEYAALTAGGVIGSFEQGLDLVRKRSQLMKKAGTNPDGSQRGSMAAGMGDVDAVLALVEKTRDGDILEAVNFNCPTQTVVAGDVCAVERFTQTAKEDRSHGVKAIPLSVSGAFHSPIMAEAAEGLAEALNEYEFETENINDDTIYLNVSGANIASTLGAAGDANWKDVMIRQIKSPVQWQKTVENMVKDGISVVIEVGPGKTLSGLVKKITSEIEVFHVEDMESLAEAAEAIKK